MIITRMLLPFKLKADQRMIYSQPLKETLLIKEGS